MMTETAALAKTNGSAAHKRPASTKRVRIQGQGAQDSAHNQTLEGTDTAKNLLTTKKKA